MMTVMREWASTGDQQVFPGKNIIALTKLSGPVDMRGGYSNHVFVAVYLFPPADVEWTWSPSRFPR